MAQRTTRSTLLAAWVLTALALPGCKKEEPTPLARLHVWHDPATGQYSAWLDQPGAGGEPGAQDVNGEFAQVGTTCVNCGGVCVPGSSTRTITAMLDHIAPASLYNLAVSNPTTPGNTFVTSEISCVGPTCSHVPGGPGPIVIPGITLQLDSCDPFTAFLDIGGVPLAANQIANPLFGADVAGWTVTGATIAHDPGVGSSEVGSLAATSIPSASLDAVFANLPSLLAPGRNRVCLNDGTGSFTCGDVSTDADFTFDVALGDVDGQNGLDVVFANFGGNNRVCLNDGTGAFTCSDVSTVSDITTGVALGDVDGQNGLDAVFANPSTPSPVCLNDGTGAFTCSAVSAVTGDLFHAQGVALGDVDGQNGLDAVFAIDSGERNRVCLNDGTGAFTCSDVSTDANNSQDVALGDVDGQNGLDAVFANDGHFNRVCLNDGTGTFTCGLVSTDSAQGVALGDVDGQNGLDAVFSNFAGNNRVCLNGGTGAFTCSDLSIAFNHGVALGDVDGQNGLDAVFANESENRVCLNDGTGTFTCGLVSTDTNDTRGVALGDMDPPSAEVATCAAVAGGQVHDFAFDMRLDAGDPSCSWTIVEHDDGVCGNPIGTTGGSFTASPGIFVQEASSFTPAPLAQSAELRIRCPGSYHLDDVSLGIKP